MRRNPTPNNTPRIQDAPVALVGRPNVGKSTLFNVLTRSRDAIVAAAPGLTRDRHYGVARLNGQACVLIDTGGLVGADADADFDALVAAQTRCAIAEAGLVCLVVNAADGLHPGDEMIAAELRKAGKTLWLVVNKTDRQSEQYCIAEFAPLGIAACFYTAAAHNRGTVKLLEALIKRCGTEPAAETEGRIRITFIGRPNVGKSTLVNHLLGTDRLLTSDTPGTTRDSIETPFSSAGRDFVLIDTAGIRRRRRITGEVEKFSVGRALGKILAADVVVIVCDATEGVTGQDASLAAKALEQGRALVIAVNKWDMVGKDTDDEQRIERSVDLGLAFLSYVEIHRISALRGAGLTKLVRAAIVAYESAGVRVPTPRCNLLLQSAVERHSPPLVGRRRIKPRYMCQSGSHPPRFTVYGNQVDKLPDNYKRYLAARVRKELALTGTPVVFEFRRNRNPYEHAVHH